MRFFYLTNEFRLEECFMECLFDKKGNQMKYIYIFMLTLILISCNEKKGYSQSFNKVINTEHNIKYLTK